jgi:hypothetical protein
MNHQTLKDIIGNLEHIKTLMFNHRINDISKSPFEGDIIELEIGPDKVLIEESKGESDALEVIDCLKQLNQSFSNIYKELLFESNFEDPHHINRIKNYLVVQFDSTMNLLGMFAVGYVDFQGNYLSISEFDIQKAELIADNKSHLNRPETLKKKITELSYRNLSFIVSLKLYDLSLIITSVKNADKLISNETEVPQLLGVRNKLLLLKELGVLDLLSEQYLKTDSSIKFAKLLALLLGLTSKNDVESIRKECKTILYNTPSKGKGGNPINKNSIMAVTNALTIIKYPVKNLPKFD